MSDKRTNDSRAALFRDGNFRWLASGAFISFLGDQFTLIALPWLMLKISGDTFALGTLIVIMSVPRTLFILLGGALVDRYSAKRVLILSQSFNGLLIGLLAFLVFTGNISMWMIYGLALCIGFASAFSLPSWSALTPQAIKPEQLPSANSTLMSSAQVTMIMGPLLAGLLIALFGSEGAEGVTDFRGMGAAFLFDCCSFAFSLFAVSRITLYFKGNQGGQQSNLLQSAIEGLRYFWNDRSLRVMFLYGVTVMLFVGGPLQVAMPVLAGQVGNSAAAFGVLTGAFGTGSLLGMIIFGLRPTFRLGTIGTTVLAIDSVTAVLFLFLGQINALWQGVALLCAIGMLGGFLQVMVQSWVQQRVSREMLGRVSSVIMFMMLGMPMVSALICGWLMRQITPGVLFVGVGAAHFGLMLFGLMATSMRTISDHGFSTPVEPAATELSST